MLVEKLHTQQGEPSLSRHSSVPSVEIKRSRISIRSHLPKFNQEESMLAKIKNEHTRKKYPEGKKGDGFSLLIREELIRLCWMVAK